MSDRASDQPAADPAEATRVAAPRRAPRDDEASARRLLATGAIVSVLGIAVGAMVTHTLGGVLLVVGWAFFLYGLHAFGRAGTP